MGRKLRLTNRYKSALEKWGPQGGSEAARRLSATLRSLASGTLPGPFDYEVMTPPVGRYWCRRVPNANLWVFYKHDDAEVKIITLQRTPPIPIVD